jgi:hypothetical protein
VEHPVVARDRVSSARLAVLVEMAKRISRGHVVSSLAESPGISSSMASLHGSEVTSYG